METGESVPCGNYTYEEYRAVHDCLTERQVEWLKGKCQWEHMTRWAVMQEWGVPAHDELEGRE